MTKLEFIELVSSSNSLTEILIKLNLRKTGGNFKGLQERIKAENLDISHIINNTTKFTIAAKLANTIPLEQILIKNSTYLNGKDIKKKLLAVGLLEDKCYECGQLPIWNNKPLKLQLDHINGTHNDNRLENLRLLCPNCHTQTETFSGKHRKKNPFSTL